MNIGSMIRGLLGENRPGEAKTVELKEGQVVRGVVLSVSESGKEAVVQIQGVPVRAELDTPLQPGQALNLQVAPPGEGGLPILKPVSLGEAALSSSQSMGEALESLGLTDSKAGREIIQAMQSGGLPLSKETAAKLEAVLQAKPQNVPSSEWLEAAVISVKRGLPVTAESVKGLQQAVFGPKLHELLSKLESELALWVQQEAEGGGGQTFTGMDKSITSFKSAATPGEVILDAPAADGEADELPSSTGKISLPASPAAEESGRAEQIKTAVLPSETKPGGASPASEQQSGAGKPADAASAAGAEETAAAGQPKLAVPSAGTMLTSPNEAAAVEQGASAVVSAGTPEADGADPAATARAAVTSEADGNGAEGLQPKAGISSGGSGPAVPAQNAAAGLNDSGAEAAASQRAATPAGAAAGRAGAATELAGAGAESAAPAKEEGAAPPVRAEAAAAGSAAGPAAERSGTALLAKLQGVLTELRGSLPQLAASPPAPAAGEPSAPAAPLPQGTTAPPAAAGQPPAPAAAEPRGDSPAATQDTESWVGRVLKLLGAEHEQQAVRAGFAGAREAAGGDDAAGTLKGVLLQVMGSSEVPPAVKEAAGQLVQQLTGQQLLLNTDRTAPFAQVTLFVPLRGEDGQETASVHIQSRRGRKGELDAANCRLWFDLDMKQLGQTLVDVQVVDRIVSLKLHNNDPWVLELLEGRRNDIQSAVESIGYQLLSLRAEPLPETAVAAASNLQSAARLADYVPDSYKGVDYRI